NFTRDLDVLGHLDGGGDEVGTMIEVDNLTFLDIVEDILDSLRVIRCAITLGARRLDAHKRGRGILFVGRPGALKNLTGTVHKGGRLGLRGKSGLSAGP